MSIAAGVPLEEYLHTEYEPDCDYMDGVPEDRNVGEKRHSRVQKRLIRILFPRAAGLGLEPLYELALRVPIKCIIDPYDREAFAVTRENPALQPCSELRWRDVTLQLSEILPE